MEYQAKSWNKPRQVVARIGWHFGECSPYLGLKISLWQTRNDKCRGNGDFSSGKAPMKIAERGFVHGPVQDFEMLTLWQ